MAASSAQQHVVDELKANGASLFTPLVGADDIDFAVRGGDGQYVELRVLEPVAGGRVFAMGGFRPKPYAFFICVESQATWVMPSHIFERFASGSPGAPSRVLDLDRDDMGEPLGDRLDVYRDRWMLITEYSKYRSTLSDPISLQMLISMG